MPQRILVIDDDEDVAYAVARMLVGYEVTVETDPVAAVWLLASGDRFDLVISDYNMPFMCGHEVHDAVTFWSSPRLPRFIVMSADVRVAEEMEAKRRSDHPFHPIVKPFRAAELRALVARVLAAGVSS